MKNVFYYSGWVQTVFIHEIGPNCVMKAKVQLHSMSRLTLIKHGLELLEKLDTVITGVWQG